MELLKPRNITVCQQFVNHAKKHVQALGWNPLNGDSLLFEWWLKNRGIVKKELNWRHDFIYDNKFIDVKEIRTQWFNIDKLSGPQTKLDQYRESIINKYLTHFLFYKTDKDHNRLLVPGDVVNITPIALTNARRTIKSVTITNNNCEGFVGLDTIKILGE